MGYGSGEIVGRSLSIFIFVFEDEPDNTGDVSLPHSGRTMMVVPGLGGA